MASLPSKRPAAAVQEEYVGFLSPEFYSGGGLGIPAGKFALAFELMNFQPRNQTTGASVGPSRLGVEVTAYPIGDPDPEANKKTQFLSMGSKADQSFAPSADGKRLVAKPGASGGLNESTNWAIFFKSLVDSGVPTEVLAQNTLEVLDGMWVNIQHVPEPEERKGFRTSTGEAGMTDQPQTPRQIPVVSEILEGGEPWNGGGGMPAASNGAAKAAPVQAAPKAATPTPITKGKSAPAPTPAGEGDVRMAAVEAIGKVIEANPNGITKIKLRNETFKAAGQSDMAEAIVSTFFADDGSLNGILGDFGYGLKGSMIQPL